MEDSNIFMFEKLLIFPTVHYDKVQKLIQNCRWFTLVAANDFCYQKYSLTLQGVSPEFSR